nr:MAG TPA: hypothetical protein [Caudoviricetes sp.]
MWRGAGVSDWALCIKGRGGLQDFLCIVHKNAPGLENSLHETKKSISTKKSPYETKKINFSYF